MSYKMTFNPGKYEWLKPMVTKPTGKITRVLCLWQSTIQTYRRRYDDFEGIYANPIITPVINEIERSGFGLIEQGKAITADGWVIYGLTETGILLCETNLEDVISKLHATTSWQFVY